MPALLLFYCELLNTKKKYLLVNRLSNITRLVVALRGYFSNLKKIKIKTLAGTGIEYFFKTSIHSLVLVLGSRLTFAWYICQV